MGELGRGQGVSAVTVTIATETYFSLTCAESIVAGEAICQSKTEAGKCYKADANDENKMPVIGIAKTSGTTGNSIDIYYAGLVSDVAKDADFDIGDTIYMSTTPGEVTKTPPTSSGSGQQKLGIAKSSDDILLDIDYTVMWLP